MNVATNESVGGISLPELERTYICKCAHVSMFVNSVVFQSPF